MSRHVHSRIESTGVGVTNIGGVLDGNWEHLEKICDPDNTNHDKDGTRDDVIRTIRDRVFGNEPQTLAPGSPIDLDFDTEPVKIIESLTAAKTFDFSNAGHGKFIYLILATLDSPQTITWPASTDLIWLAAAPTSVGGPNYTITSITASGTLWTVTTSVAHGFAIGDDVEIDNSDVGAYDGQHAVNTVPTTTTFTIADVSTPGSATTGNVWRLPLPFTFIKLWVLGGQGGNTDLVLGEVIQEDK